MSVFRCKHYSIQIFLTTVVNENVIVKQLGRCQKRLVVYMMQPPDDENSKNEFL